MKNIKLINFAWKNILRCRDRSRLTIFGQVLAIMIFSVILTLLFYSEKALDNVLSNTGTHFIAFKPLCCGLPYLQNKKQDFIANEIASQPMPIQFIEEIKKIPEVKEASPFILYEFRETNRQGNYKIGGFDINSTVTVPNTCCSAKDITYGRFLNKDDSTAVILEESYAMSKRFKVGEKFYTGGRTMTIVGIVNPGIRPAKADVYMLIQIAEKIIGSHLGAPVSHIMNIVLVEAANAYVHRKAMMEVNEVMGKESILSTYGCYKPASGALNINTKVLGILFVLVFLFVVLISFKNQYASIIEKKHDFGILSAIGWSSKKIIAMISLESLLQVSISGLTAVIIFFILFIAIPIQTILNTTAQLAVNTVCIIFLWGFLTVAVVEIIIAIIPAWYSVKRLPSKNLHILH